MRTTELDTLVKNKHVILMKNGMTHLVKEITAKKIAEHLETQDSHSFIRIDELGGIAINSADISGIYTPVQHNDLIRLNAGEYMCSFENWHKKKEICGCAAELARKRHEELERIRRNQEYRPLTDEEKAANAEYIRKGDEMHVLSKPDSIFRSKYLEGSRSGKKIRRSTIREWEKLNGKKADVGDLAIDEDAK